MYVIYSFGFGTENLNRKSKTEKRKEQKGAKRRKGPKRSKKTKKEPYIAEGNKRA